MEANINIFFENYDFDFGSYKTSFEIVLNFWFKVEAQVGSKYFKGGFQV